MRISTGEFKGRKLETPDNNDIRPTSDKVKEAMFSILTNDVPGAVCCDLFAGTGNLGLEALSRGAELCYFCDSSRASIGIIHRNIEHCGATERSVVLTGDYKKTLKRINRLLEDIDRHGYNCIGKPEPLTENLAGYWSVRIDEKNRIVFRIHDDAVEIMQCGSHYGDT